MSEKNKTKEIIKEAYTQIASKKCGCQCGTNSSEKELAFQIGYSAKEVNDYSDANLGLGCGNPLALSKINKGETVLDLGSGAGFDSFIAAKSVGKNGKVIGIDMTEKMIKKAKENAQKYKIDNVEFILGDIESLPIEENKIDVITSNCVINLAPNKDKVFQEAYRVLKKGGRMYVSDIVLLDELTLAQKTDERLLYGCVAGALQKQDYLNKVRNVGFNVRILNENKDISKQQYAGINLESIKIEAIKE